MQVKRDEHEHHKQALKKHHPFTSCKKKKKETLSCSSFGFPLQRWLSISVLTELHAVKCLSQSGSCSLQDCCFTDSYLHKATIQGNISGSWATSLQSDHTLWWLQEPHHRQGRACPPHPQQSACCNTSSPAQQEKHFEHLTHMTFQLRLESSALAEFYLAEPKASACECNNNQVSSIFPLIRLYISTHEYFKVTLYLTMNSYCYCSKQVLYYIYSYTYTTLQHENAQSTSGVQM